MTFLIIHFEVRRSNTLSSTSAFINERTFVPLEAEMTKMKESKKASNVYIKRSRRRNLSVYQRKESTFIYRTIDTTGKRFYKELK